MGKFCDFVELNDTEKIINYLASYIITNDDVCRCLRFNSTDCLSQTLTDADRNVLTNTALDNKDRRIYFSPFLDKTFQEQITQLRIYFADFHVRQRNLATAIINIEIICHNNLWDLNDSRIRPLVLINELAKSINGNEVKGIGLITLENGHNPLVAYNDYISGYRLTFSTGVE